MRSFTYVDDVVNINKFVALLGIPGEAYNCASGLKVTIEQIATALIQLSGATSKIQYEDWKIGDIKDFDVSNAKIRNLGFEFDYLDFKQGLTETFRWYERELN